MPLRSPWRLLAAAALLGLPASVGLAQSAKVAAEASQGPVLDLNTATAAQLRALPGMGDVYVRRVIEGRPYSAKNQLVTRGVLPRGAYEGIRDRIVAHRPARDAQKISR